jgi:hypothetical protein
MKSTLFPTALISLLALAACVPSYQAPQPYYETRLGFYFLIPSTWPTGRYGEREYTAIELTQTQPLSSGAIELYYIPMDNTKPVQSLFRIYQYTKANWATAQATPGLDRPQLVKSGDVIYAAVLPSTNPYDPTTPDGKMYATMVLTLDQIANSIVKR